MRTLSQCRASTQLIAVFILKVSSSLWKATRVNVIGSPPECPEYMSEPAFARLLFMDECFVCGKIETNSRECPIYWEIQMRCCDKCLDGRYCPAHHIFPEEVVTLDFTPFSFTVALPPKATQQEISEDEEC
ncbi:hypothetical protein FRB94_009175 [Tulasnella sp. JGI-2019a]|nr:hypothetical protein FRB94_009175 [Tulasnella sp. JGI-2019a]